MKTETEWAIRNLELAGAFDKDSAYGGMIGEAVKELLEVHSKQKHSGMSHELAITLFYRVSKGEALTDEFWLERFNEYNEFVKAQNMNPWTEEKFEEIVMRRPKKNGQPEGKAENE